MLRQISYKEEGKKNKRKKKFTKFKINVRNIVLRCVCSFSLVRVLVNIFFYCATRLLACCCNYRFDFGEEKKDYTDIRWHLQGIQKDFENLLVFIQKT